MIMRGMRTFGALAILAVGAVHLQQYIGADYRSIPTIGTLFLLNAIGSAVVGIGLLIPVERLLVARRADLAIGILALGAVAIAVGSLVSILISESSSLFGFTESGYRAPIVVAIIAEAATVVLLAPVATVSLVHAVSRRREARRRRDDAGVSRRPYRMARQS